MKKLLLATAIITTILFSCSKPENNPAPIQQITIVNPPSPLDTTTSDTVLMNLEFYKKTTTFANCSDCDMWTINEGNCIVKQYYLNGLDTIPHTIDQNYPIFLELSDSGWVNYSGCLSQQYPQEYLIDGNQFTFENQTFTIVVNDNYTFEFFVKPDSNTETYYIYNKR